VREMKCARKNVKIIGRTSKGNVRKISGNKKIKK
jgi:hypothetical protein